MPKSVFVQTNGTAGELSPRLLGRSDLSKYANGFQILQNFIVQKHGGIIRRSGSKFVAAVKEHPRLTRLVEFKFSVSENYVLEFGHKYIRFYRDRIQLVQQAGDPSPGTITEIASPWNEDDLRRLKYVQNADVLIVCHPDYQPRELQRTAGADTDPATWSLITYDYVDGPYQDINITATTLTPAATSGNGVTVTASSAIFAATDAATATQKGRSIRLSNPTSGEQWGEAEIVDFNSSTSVDVDIHPNRPFARTTATTDWRLGAWSDTTGWPHTPEFHHQRLCFGATDSEPMHIWTTRTNRLRVFGPSDPSDGTVRDDDGIMNQVADDQVNTIRWMKSDRKGLFIFTGGGPFVGRSRGDEFEPITPGNFNVTREGVHRAHATVRPHHVGRGLLLPTQSGRKIREFSFSFEADAFVAPDMTLLSEHITFGGIVDSAYQDEPDSILWCVRQDGALIGMTYERLEDVVGWHRHVLGGRWVDATSVEHPAQVEACAVIPDDQGVEGVIRDILWIVVKRTIAGETRRYIEFIEDPFDVDTVHADAFFVDSGLSYDGPATDNFVGLDHLQNETVNILADGATHPPLVVSGGAIQLEYDAEKVQIGLPMPFDAITMPLVPQAPGFDPRGKLLRPYELHLRLYRSLGGFVEVVGHEADELIYRDEDDEAILEPWTGTQTKSLASGHDRDQAIRLSGSDPQPMQMLNLIAEFQVGSE